MKLPYISLAVALIGASLSADVHSQKPPAPSPLKELSWISSHFETSTEVVRVLDDAGKQDHSTTTTQKVRMTFQGCKATLVVSQQFLHVASDGKTDNDYSGTITSQIDLSNLLTAKLRAVSRNQESCYTLNILDGKPAPDCPDLKGVTAPPQLITLLLPAATPIPSEDSVWGSASTKSMQIRFSTLDMANRQADAWRTAILACGGK